MHNDAEKTPTMHITYIIQWLRTEAGCTTGLVTQVWSLAGTATICMERFQFNLQLKQSTSRFSNKNESYQPG
jgi:hypothetical protein